MDKKKLKEIEKLMDGVVDEGHKWLKPIEEIDPTSMWSGQSSCIGNGKTSVVVQPDMTDIDDMLFAVDVRIAIAKVTMLRETAIKDGSIGMYGAIILSAVEVRLMRTFVELTKSWPLGTSTVEMWYRQSLGPAMLQKNIEPPKV